MSYSSHHSFSFNDAFEDALDDEFNNCMEECLDDINEVLEPKKRKKKRAVIDRGHEEGNIRLINDYFSENAIYPEAIFRRRFRMNRPLFMRIVSKLSELRFFQQIPDTTGKMGLSGLQKCTAGIRMLAYGTAADVRSSEHLPSNVHNIMANRADIRDQENHHQLKADLVEHIWNKFSS